jgi:hypothetical protein
LDLLGVRDLEIQMSEALKESILLEIPTDYGELLDHFHTEMWNRMGWVFERGLVLVDLRVGLLLSLRTPQSKSTVYDFRWQWSSCKEFYTPPDILLKDGHLLEWKGAPHGVVHSYSGSPEKALWYAGNFRERGGSHITRGARPHYVWVEGTNVLKRRWQTFAADLLGEKPRKTHVHTSHHSNHLCLPGYLQRCFAGPDCLSGTYSGHIWDAYLVLDQVRWGPVRLQYGGPCTYGGSPLSYLARNRSLVCFQEGSPPDSGSLGPYLGC